MYRWFTLEYTFYLASFWAISLYFITIGLEIGAAANAGDIELRRVERRPMEWVHGIFPTMPAGWFNGRLQVGTSIQPCWRVVERVYDRIGLVWY